MELYTKKGIDLNILIDVYRSEVETLGSSRSHSRLYFFKEVVQVNNSLIRNIAADLIPPGFFKKSSLHQAGRHLTVVQYKNDDDGGRLQSMHR